CGAGGFSAGLFEAGFDVLAGVDWDCDAAQTYMVNLGAYPIDVRFVAPADRDRFADYLERQVQRSARGNPAGIAQLTTSGAHCAASHPVPVFWFGDIRQLSGEALLESIGLEVGELDLLVGGPPCQGYSMAGRRNVMDPRNSLVFEFVRLALEIRPRAICMENVPGMLSMVTETGAPVVDGVCRLLESGGFGEYAAMRQVLAGGDGRRIVSRHAGKRRE